MARNSPELQKLIIARQQCSLRLSMLAQEKMRVNLDIKSARIELNEIRNLIKEMREHGRST